MKGWQMCSAAWTPLRINRWSSQILSQMWWDMLHDCGCISFTVGPALPLNMSLLLMGYGKGLQEQYGSHRCCREAVTCSGCHCWSSRHCIPKRMHKQVGQFMRIKKKLSSIKTLTIKKGNLSMLSFTSELWLTAANYGTNVLWQKWWQY